MNPTRHPPESRGPASGRPESGGTAAAAFVEVRPGTLRHLEGIVRCHQAAFPDQFLTRLGSEFLAAHYRFYLESPRGITLVATGAGGQVLGFVSGGDPALRGRFIRTRVPWFAGMLLYRGLRDSFVRRRLLVHLRHGLRALAGRLGGTSASPDETGESEGVSVLLSIAVDPSAAGRGIGRMLMEAFLRESRRLGYPAMVLSAHPDNEAAIRLYLACGWEVVRREPDGVYFRRSTDP